ncbi:MAG: EAL domain-containing protein [Campylobacterota bacterium]|nr:EAL domain-containing protein [Campylobacterota bacterium]
MYDTTNLKEISANFTILIAEDDEPTRGQIQGILELFFSDVYIAKNGVEAFEIYKEKKPDIIMTDLTMPRMCGIELTKSVRELHPNQKIIVMSAHTETDIIVNAIRSNIDGYVLKPLNAMQMFEALEKTAVSLKMEKENISYQKNLELRVEKQAQELIKRLEYDSLTNLPNKIKLQLDFNQNRCSEFILLNIDNFSQINSAYGHEDGDILLQKVATFLQFNIDETIYRGNGDEFLISLKSATPDEALELAQTIKDKIYTEHFSITQTSVRLTFSIAIVSVNEDDDDIPYSKAQLAIMDMRKLHKNIIGRYEEQSQTKIYNKQMNEWANKVKLALDDGSLLPYYQPIVNLSTNEVEKYECLARIIEQDNPISPFYFIEPARIAGMVTDITREMIQKAFTTFSNSDKEFSINITDDDFKEEYLINYLQDNCKKFNIKPSQVVLEVLENISNYDASHAIKQIDTLKEIGFQIAIDDFRAESSNFARVQKLKIDYIKIDGAFIKDIATNKNSLIITKTIVFYAKNCGIKTIAEFVHNKETYEIVKELGIDYAQGFYLAEPLKDIL